VSVGLGVTQRRALALLASQANGRTTAELSAMLDLTDRRCRAVIDSLRRRNLVVVAKDAGEARRVWSTEQRRAYVADRAYVKGLLSRHRTTTSRGMTCSNCGHWNQTHV
jgi:DNA-binding MarR family transcriptional regulator